MSNPLYGQMQQQIPQNNIFQRFQQFQRMFKGDAEQQVKQLLNSGRVNQQQYNNAVQMANQFMKMMGGK
jgi:vancomycin permeability regulator SanA